MTDQRIVLFTFAGRRENMEVQAPFLQRLLDTYPGLTVEHWNMTRNESDNEYVRSLHNPDDRIIVRNDYWPGDNDWPVGCRRKLKRPRWCGCKDCRPAPFEKPYAWYVENGDPDAVYIKTDDDVIFMETDTFGDLLTTLADHPNAVVSANVINNVVSAKHDSELRPMMEQEFEPKTQRDWFMLHISADFARESHRWFLDHWERLTRGAAKMPNVRVLPGERPSINFIGFTYPTLQRMVAVMANPLFSKMGDEGTICQNFLPRIVRSFTVCHLYFGPQRAAMTDVELDDLRRRYAEVAKEYLG